MNLDSVRSLKQELRLSNVLQSFATRASMPAAQAAPGGALPSVAPVSPIALGIAPTPNGFKLAVRIFELTPGIQDNIDRIVDRAQGEVSLRLVGRVVKQAPWHQTRNRPLLMGGSTGFVPPHGWVMAGTVGAFVKGAEDEVISILSNNHVLADENRLAPGSDILQQSSLDGGAAPHDIIAELSSFVPLRAHAVNFVDAAIARVHHGVFGDARTITGLGNLNGIRTAPLVTEETVYKVGRTTGKRKGRITAFELDGVSVRYDLGKLVFDDQIEIAPDAETGGPFSLSGDSGSLVVDENLQAVGLLFAGNDVDRTYANPISAVLQELGVRLA